ncbi:MAG: hypothetical protein SFY80_12215 [Verrucomicrobiota bacterium]|nr:hypothetical protein [Verrucomicrobiota bacterium]
MKLPIVLCEGIGDSLFILSLIPHQRLAQLGIRFEVYYDSPLHPSSPYWFVYRLLKELIAKLPHLELMETPPTPSIRRRYQILQRLFRRRYIYVNSQRSARWEGRIWHGLQGVLGVRPYYAIAVAPKTPLPPTSKHRLLIHTHLDGAPFKRWKMESWIEVIQALLTGSNADKIEVWVLEWNAEAIHVLRQRMPQIMWLKEYAADFGELVALTASMDLFVGVDSWTKYVAAWNCIPSVIIIPSHLENAHCGRLEALTCVDWLFNGIFKHPLMKVIGIEIRGDKVEYSLDSMDQLSPVTVIEQIEKLHLLAGSSNPQATSKTQSVTE